MFDGSMQAILPAHLVTFVCHRRLPHLADDATCHLVAQVMEATRRRYELRFYGFVFMPEHVHLLVAAPRLTTLAHAVQSIQCTATRLARARWPDKAASPTRLWLRGFDDCTLSNRAAFVATLRDLHRNPVRRGLCAAPEQWRWSSFRHYRNDVEVGIALESAWAADVPSLRTQ